MRDNTSVLRAICELVWQRAKKSVPQADICSQVDDPIVRYALEVAARLPARARGTGDESS